MPEEDFICLDILHVRFLLQMPSNLRNNDVSDYSDKAEYFKYFIGTYCRQLNKEPLSRLENNLQHMSRTECSIFCRQTEGCLGFSLATDNLCSIFKTSQQVEIITNVVDYYERC